MKECAGCGQVKPLEDFGETRGRVRAKCKPCRAQAERDRNAVKRQRKTCSVCGGPLHGTAKLDVCRRNPECKRISESRHNFNGSRRRRSYRPCAGCGKDWLRGNRAERLCGECQKTLFWCSGISVDTGHAARRSVRVGAGTCRVCRLLRRASERAEIKGIPFDLSREDVEAVWTDTCPYLGIPLVHGSRKLARTSPTLDRIIPELGYVAGNVEVVSHQANSMKGEASAEQLVTFARVVLARFADREVAR